MDKKFYLDEVLKYAALMENKGMTNGFEGNFSVIDRETGLAYITPSAKRKSYLLPEHIAVMKGEEQVDGEFKRSSEYFLHKACYDARPDCNAVAHMHPPFLTAFAYAGKPLELRCSTTFALLCGNEIPCLPYGRPGTKDIAKGIDELLSHSDIVLLENHGVVCVGPDLNQACAVIESMEEVAKTYAYSRFMGLTEKNIPAEEYAVIAGSALKVAIGDGSR